MLAAIGFITVIAMLVLIMTKKLTPTVALILVPFIAGIIASFFIVTEEPTSKNFVAFLNRIELKGIWLSRPFLVYNDKLLDCKRGHETTIVCREDDILELSNLDEMIDVYKQRYVDDVNKLVEKIKVCRKTVAGLKNATRTLRDDVTKMYFDALKLPTSREL